ERLWDSIRRLGRTVFGWRGLGSTGAGGRMEPRRVGPRKRTTLATIETLSPLPAITSCTTVPSLPSLPPFTTRRRMVRSGLSRVVVDIAGGARHPSAVHFLSGAP